MAAASAISLLCRQRCPLDPSVSGRVVLDMPLADPVFAGVLAEFEGLTSPGAGAGGGGGRFEIQYAPALDFYWQTFVLDSATFDRQADGEGRFYSPLDLRSHAHLTEEAILLRLLKSRPVVFDFGMGPGHWLMHMQAFGMEVHGFDVSETSRRCAAAHGMGFGPLESYPDESFDFINADQVFEHLVDPMPVVRQIGRKLKPGGLCKIATPGDGKIPRKLGRLARGGYTAADAFEKHNLGALYPMHHVNCFSRRALGYLARAGGLEPFRVPLRYLYGSCTGPFSLRQIERCCVNPLKRYLSRRTWQYYRKP